MQPEPVSIPDQTRSLLVNSHYVCYPSIGCLVYVMRCAVAEKIGLVARPRARSSARHWNVHYQRRPSLRL